MLLSPNFDKSYQAFPELHLIFLMLICFGYIVYRASTVVLENEFCPHLFFVAFTNNQLNWLPKEMQVDPILFLVESLC